MRIDRILGYLYKFYRSTKNQNWKRRFFLFRNSTYTKLWPKGVKINNYPIYALIEPTNHCNLNCETCIRKDLKIGFGNLSFEDFKNIVDKLKGLIRIHLQGQGEPFLNKEIFDMINYASNNGIIVTTTNNGTLINEKIAKKIIDSKLDEIVISVDSIDKKTCEKIRKGIKFDNLIENIRRLSEMRKNRKRPLKMSIGMTIIKDNIKEIPSFIDFFSKLKIDEIFFLRLITNKFYVKHYEKNFLKNQLVCKEDLEESIKKNKKLAKIKKIKLAFNEDKCNWLWDRIYINYRGDVNPCCMVLDPENPKLGNILKQDFREIWNCEEYKRLRQILTNKNIPSVCEGCRILWK